VTAGAIADGADIREPEPATGTVFLRTAVGCRRAVPLRGTGIHRRRADIDADTLTSPGSDSQTHLSLGGQQKWEWDSSGTLSPFPNLLCSDSRCCSGRGGPHHRPCGSSTAAASHYSDYSGLVLLAAHIVREEHNRTVADRSRGRTCSRRGELARN
jgi:hypothetical protein